MVRVDLWVLDMIFQRITDWVNNLIGLNCFGQARMLWRIALFNSMLIVVISHHEMIEMAFGMIVLVPLTYLNLWLVHRDEKEHEKNPKFMNKRRVDSHMRVFLFFFLFAPDIINLRMIAVLLHVNIISALYAGACTPRPPKPKTQTRLALANR